jgi:hypothetical protein
MLKATSAARVLLRPAFNQGQNLMAQTKFSAGQRVSVTRANSFAAPGGSYRIVRALPLESGPQQYRVRNDNEMFDRIVEESRLEAVRLD